MLLLALVACKHPDPAPADLDGLAHYFWQKYDSGTAEELSEALVNLDAAVSAASVDALGSADAYLTEPFHLTVSDLTKEEQELVLPGDARDPSLARGFVVFNPLPCQVEQVERFVYEADQMGLYPEAYSAYSREYTSDFDAYVARSEDRLTWHTELTSTTAGFTYHEKLDGGIRHVAELDPQLSPFGAFTVNRTWLVEPACFGDDCASNDAHFDQDHQLEIHYQRTDDTVLHAYVIWRQAEYFGMSQENDGLINAQIDGLLDWDDDTAALCVAERAG